MSRGQTVLMRLLIVAAAALALLASQAYASPAIRYGVQDDAWLRYGPGTLTQRLDRLQTLGVELMRVNVNWNEVQPRPRTFIWRDYDPVIKGLHARGIEPVLTLVGSPAWANGGLPSNFAPTKG